MNYPAKAIEALGERMGEQVKGITQRLGQEAGKEGYTLAWLEQQVFLALKGIYVMRAKNWTQTRDRDREGK